MGGSVRTCKVIVWEGLYVHERWWCGRVCTYMQGDGVGGSVRTCKVMVWKDLYVHAR